MEYLITNFTVLMPKSLNNDYNFESSDAKSFHGITRIYIIVLDPKSLRWLFNIYASRL